MCEVNLNEIVSLKKILMECTKAKRVPYSAIFGKSQKRELVEVKQAFCILSKELINSSPEELGNFLNKDRTTILYYFKQGHIPSIKKIIETVRKCYTRAI